MGVFIFGFYVPLDQLMVGFFAILILAVIVISFLNRVDEEVNGDYRFRQALFHHSDLRRQKERAEQDQD